MYSPNKKTTKRKTSYKLENKELRDRFFDAISKGATYGLACDYAGISSTQFRKWKDAAYEKIEEGYDGDDDLHVNFLRELRRVEADLACECLDDIRDAGKSDWKASAFILTKKFKDHYGENKEELNNKLDQNNEELKNIREMMSKCMTEKS